MWDSISDVLIDWALHIINLFPESPVRVALDGLTVGPIGRILGVVNYILPVSQIMGIMAFWLTAVACYYVYQVLLRWIRVIE